MSDLKQRRLLYELDRLSTPLLVMAAEGLQDLCSRLDQLSSRKVSKQVLPL